MPGSLPMNGAEAQTNTVLAAISGLHDLADDRFQELRTMAAAEEGAHIQQPMSRQYQDAGNFPDPPDVPRHDPDESPIRLVAGPLDAHMQEILSPRHESVLLRLSVEEGQAALQNLKCRIQVRPTVTIQATDRCAVS